MNGVLGPRFYAVSLYWPGTTWANEMKFVMNHVPSAGSIARPIDQRSSALPLYMNASRICESNLRHLSASSLQGIQYKNANQQLMKQPQPYALTTYNLPLHLLPGAAVVQCWAA